MIYKPYIKNPNGTLSELSIISEVATKLGTRTIGTPIKPIYLEEGTPKECEESLKTNRQILDMIYPIGAIYMSVNSTSPATLFGGTWEQIKDRFILSAGDSYTAGATGGEATHTLTTAEMPNHNHTFAGNSTNYQFGDVAYGSISGSNQNVTITDGTDSYGKGGTYSTRMRDTAFTVTPSGTVGNTGSGTAHNNMPPYLVVYMWKRTA